MSIGIGSKENVDDANDLLEHAEWGEALSLICTQLFEYDVQNQRWHL